MCLWPSTQGHSSRKCPALRVQRGAIILWVCSQSFQDGIEVILKYVHT